MTAAKSLKVVLFLVLASIVSLPMGLAFAQNTATSITVDLNEFEGSGISGTAVLTENDAGGVHVSMKLLGEALDGNHPTHIHTGTCSNFDPSPIYPLETVNLNPVNQQGISESDVTGTTLDTLRNGKFVILVHQSPEELTNYLVCGDIGAGESGARSMPIAGTGFGTTDTWSGTVAVLVLASVALMSAAGAEMLRRRQH
jgi:hypothetical protein